MARARSPAGTLAYQRDRAAKIAAGGTVGFPGRAQHASPRRIRRRAGGRAASATPHHHHAAIRQLLIQSRDHFDPDGTVSTLKNMVVIGHSMGGMIARLLVSSADNQLHDWAMADARTDPNQNDPERTLLDPMLRFESLAGIERAIFIATLHRGTAIAGYQPVRWLSGLFRLPLTAQEAVTDAVVPSVQATGQTQDGYLQGTLNSIDHLNQDDPFVQAATKLPISPEVRYHSIIARTNADGPLADSDAGLVPYRSAHLPDAVSEKIIISGHKRAGKRRSDPRSTPHPAEDLAASTQVSPH
ncbi:hypothetical protein SAMN05216379_11728 [Nitrosomonas eutropha]|nr:hypothetical protein SAMN05216379_11728 [Nitrosomonas eutropha]